MTSQLSRSSSSSSSSSSSIMICPEKLVTRELSNMSSINEAYYHGDKAASVPFEWESEPGTPKFKPRGPSLPPLSPPPSYYCNKTSMSSKESKHKKSPNSKPGNILQTLFVKRATRKQPHLPSHSSSSYSSSSSSLSSPAYFSAPSSPVICSTKSVGEEDLYDVDLHSSARWRGGCSFMIKKVLQRDFL